MPAQHLGSSASAPRSGVGNMLTPRTITMSSAAAGDLLHPPHRARRARQQPRQVARAIAHHRHRLLGQRGEHQFAPLALRQHRTGLGIDRSRGRNDPPRCAARPSSRRIRCATPGRSPRTSPTFDCIHVEAVLDFRAHRVGPGLGAENADLERARARIHALARGTRPGSPACSSASP